jgi:hypothetical protein
LETTLSGGHLVPGALMISERKSETPPPVNTPEKLPLPKFSIREFVFAYLSGTPLRYALGRPSGRRNFEEG